MEWFLLTAAPQLAPGRPLFAPGEPEPEWLHRAAEHARILALPGPDQPAGPPGERRGIAARLRLARARE